MNPSVVAAVINWNGIEDTRRCVTSILASDYPDLRVNVIDNGSDSDEASVLEASFPAIDAVRLTENLGYGGAANVAIADARNRKRDYVLLLNNDTTLAEDAVSMLVRAAREAGDHAIIAPLIIRPDGRVWSAGGTLSWPWASGEHVGIGDDPSNHTAKRIVDWSSGCALFVPTTCFDEVGGFDESYFLYLEDMDWCLRARRMGHAIWCAPSARVVHEVTKTVNSIDPRIGRYYAYRNFYRVGMRHAPVAWRVWLAAHLAVSLTKVTIRNILFSRYRRDSFYNARTRALLDFVRGRDGKAPYEHRILAPVERTTVTGSAL
jgi:GT2 family glycosyltransferase